MISSALSRPRRVWYLTILLLSALFLYWLLLRDLRFFLVPSRSMEPTLAASEYILSTSEGEYRRGDVIVVDDPALAGGYLVKRLVGLPGDRVSIEGGALYLDGVYVSEPYIAEPTQYSLPEYVVPDRQVFVLGDNRNLSVDSHDWRESQEGGTPETAGVPLDSIVGKVRFVYLPIGKARRVGSFPVGLRQIAH
jgi:signal peptidase I